MNSDDIFEYQNKIENLRSILDRMTPISQCNCYPPLCPRGKCIYCEAREALGRSTKKYC